MAKKDVQMRHVVDTLFRAKQRLQELQYDEDLPQELGSPATDAQLQSLVSELGGPLPPSYEAFLRLHDGWTEFDGGAQILSTEERKKNWVLERLAGIKAHLKSFGDDPVLDDAFIVVLGVDESNFTYFDKTKRLENGELEVVHYDLEDGEYGRYPSFLAFLEDALSDTEAMIEEEEG
jgi:hypothetical protein